MEVSMTALLARTGLGEGDVDPGHRLLDEFLNPRHVLPDVSTSLEDNTVRSQTLADYVRGPAGVLFVDHPTGSNCSIDPAQHVIIRTGDSKEHWLRAVDPYRNRIGHTLLLGRPSQYSTTARKPHSVSWLHEAARRWRRSITSPSTCSGLSSTMKMIRFPTSS